MKRQIATLFGVGCLKGAPGTYGSLLAIPFAYALHASAGPAGVIAGALSTFALGLWAAAFADGQHHDPPEVIIDEFAGQLIVFVPVSLWLQTSDIDWHATIMAAMMAFTLFRLFDITKPGPIGWADRHLEGSLGVMLDDLLAGLASAIVISLVIIFPW